VSVPKPLLIAGAAAAALLFVVMLMTIGFLAFGGPGTETEEPTVTITKTIDSIDQATGDVTWKVVVSNTGNTKAYDVSLNDAEPGGANESTLFNLSQTGSASNLNVTSGNGSTALIATMDLGAGLSETFTYKTTVTNRAAPVADATATLSYTSLNDNTAFSGTNASSLYKYNANSKGM